MFPDSSKEYEPKFIYPQYLYSKDGIKFVFMGESPFHHDGWYVPNDNRSGRGISYGEAMKAGFTKQN